MQNGDFDDDLNELIRLSNNSIISDITAYKLFDLQDMVNDIDNSKGILKATLGTFFEELDKYFVKAFRLIEKRGLESEIADKLCIHALVYPKIDKRLGKAKKIRKFCKGRVFKSVFKNSGLEIRFDDHIDQKGNIKTGFDERACLYNDFMRQVKLREQFDRSGNSRP